MRHLPPPPTELLSEASLFLDFDGTLTEFVDPAELPSNGAQTGVLLRKLSRQLGGRVAVVSGRSLDLLIDLVEVDQVELAGSHGLERRAADGTRTAHTQNKDLSALHQESRQIGQQLGIVVEEKSAGAAFHYRGLPAVERQVQGKVEELAQRHQLEFRRGSMVFEVRVPGPHKGDAIRTLMTEVPFRKGTPIFVGDDLTDEDGFAAARDLGGHGILVGEERETLADFRLDSVKSTLEWLAQ